MKRCYHYHPSTNKRHLFTTLLAILISTNLIFAQERKLNDDAGTAVQRHPAIAASPSGNGVLCWEDYRNGDPDIYGQVFSQKGQFIGANFLMNETPSAGKQVRPAVAMNNRSQFVVVWEDSSAAEVAVYARWFAANQKPLTGRVKVNSSTIFSGTLNPAVAMDGLGNTVVCWQDDRNNASTDIYFQRYDAQGRPIGSNRLVNNVLRDDQINPAVAANADGEFIIVWDDRRDYSSAHMGNIYSQRYSVFGTALDSNRVISHHPANQLPYKPSVALQRNGDYMAVWEWVGVGSGLGISACFISNSDVALNKEFAISDGSSLNPVFCRMPYVYPRLENGFVVVFNATISNTMHIFSRSYDTQGHAETEPVQRSEQASLKNSPCLMVGWQGMHVAIWTDMRNGHWDIYGQCWGPQIPLNVTAGSGFNGRVPISWDPPYGMDNIKRYSIRRSTNMNGPFSLVASVDLSTRGAAGSLMRDWVDASVTNGTTYYYTVTSDESGTDGASQIAKATPSADGHVLISPWTGTAPTVDGLIDEAEWRDARKINIAAPFIDHPVDLYIKNDGTRLYLAADDPVDTIIDPLNQLCILFDLNHNGAWPAGPGSGEGLLSINSTGAWFMGYYGTYPDHLGANAAVKATNVTSQVSTTSGHVQYEAAITVAHTAGQTIGFTAWVQDPSSVYPMHYGWAGEWPFGSLWETAGTLGDLVFSGQPPAPNKYTVTNTNDSGPGSLRQAILDAENHSGTDSVLFRIPTTDAGYDAAAGVWTIRLSSYLALIKRATIVDAGSQARFLGYDANPAGPEILLLGANATISSGINISGNANEIRGFCLQNFKQQFIMIQGDSNRISKCYLGTDATGMRRIANTADGIVVYSGNYNVIGGDNQERNVMAGLHGGGVVIKIESRYNRVVGNYIGINAAGTDTLSNYRGVEVTRNSSQNVVGPGNVVSGNRQRGVAFTIDGCDSNKVIGNFIGTDPSGHTAMGNMIYGVYIEACPLNCIGGATVEERNVISGNKYTGIIIAGSNAYANRVQGNYIGVDASGSAALLNESNGVRISNGAHHNLIGGDKPGQGNVIAANLYNGILLESSGTNENQIIGNCLGTDVNGTMDLGNGECGVQLLNGAAYNTIGPDNIIAFNRLEGVALTNDHTDFNLITKNRIYKNKYYGAIHLFAGTNKSMAAPVIHTINPVSGQSIPYATIELFSTVDNQADLYEATVVADVHGNFSWDGTARGPFITASATDTRNNTSELSLPLTTAVNQQTMTQPIDFKLEQNYPNPFNPVTNIRFCVKERCRVELAVFDLIGRQTAKLIDAFYAPGWHEKSVQMPAHASGVYLYRIKMKDFSECKKMILLQ